MIQNEKLQKNMTHEHKCKNLQIFIYRTHLCLKEIMYYDKVQSTQEFNNFIIGN